MAKLQSSISLDTASKKHINNMARYLTTFGVDVQRVMENEAQDVLKAMKKDVRVDTRRLQRSITAQRNTDNGVDFSASAIDPLTGKDYAAAQEFGGKNISFTPYFFHNLRKYKSNVTRTLSLLLRSYSSLGSSFRKRQ